MTLGLLVAARGRVQHGHLHEGTVCQERGHAKEHVRHSQVWLVLARGL